MPSGRPRPSALLLDADGTLWDTRTAMEAAGAAGVRAAWPGVADDVAAGAARRYRSDPTNVFGAFVAGELTFEEMRRTRLREVAAEAGLPWTDDAPSLFESAYGPQSRGRWRPSRTRSTCSAGARLLVCPCGS